jgi:hypothetical protein
MKTRVLCIITVLALVAGLLPGLGLSAAAANDVCINEENFPDAVFRNAVRSFDNNNDGVLSLQERRSTAGIGVSYKGISTLKGIEYFSWITALECSGNQLTELDLSGNPVLGTLICESNRLNSLNVTANPRLSLLNCADNELTSLDLSGNQELERLACYKNQLNELDLSLNPELTLLSCGYNPLTGIDVSQNPELNTLSCGSCQITALDLGQNTSLKTLDCTNNLLTALDLSRNPLRGLSCYGNPIPFLNVRNNTLLRKTLLEGEKIASVTAYNRYERFDILNGLCVIEYDLATKTIPAGNSEPVCEHAWDEGVTLSEPDCVHWGQRVFTCTLCGETYYEYLEPLGHDWSEWATVQELDCEHDGIQSRVCTRCGEAEELTKSALGHAWKLTEILAVGETPHVSTGLYTCSRCGATKEDRLCAGEFFRDMPADDHWAHDAIDWAYFNGITAGKTKKTFAPDDTVTRAEAMTFLWAALDRPEPTLTENPFRDVPESQYYYLPVLWAVENHVTDGVSKTRFGPDRTCTRAQIVTFLWAAAGRPEPETMENRFKDVTEEDYFYQAVLWAVENHVTDGVSKTKFGPDRTCTRAQIVTFLYKAAPILTAEPELEPAD